MRVAIIDYGSGNLRSATKAFERAAREAGIDAEIDLTDKADSVASADPLILDDNSRMPLSLSVGIASLDLSAGNLTGNDVLSVVDQALYSARRNGGNQVVSNQF